MSLNARPKRYMTDDDWQFYDFMSEDRPRGTGDVQVIFPYENHRPAGLVIECEMAHPKSMKGRTVYVYLDNDDVTKVLLACRDAARLARSQPEAEAKP